MRFDLKKIFIATAYVLVAVITKAQPGCPAVNAGNNVNLSCGTTCTTLKAVPFQVGATDNYSVAQIPYAPPVAFNVGTSIPIPSISGDDYWSPVIYLPFNFCFFDSVYTSVIVSSNGAISFDTTNANNSADWIINGPFPDPTLPDMDASISGPYQDLDNTNQGTIYWYIGGTYPCRYFVATWDNLDMYGDSMSVENVQEGGPPYCNEDDHQYQMIVIYETTNAVDIYVKEKDVPCDDGGQGYWNSGEAVEGIQNADFSTFIGVPGRNATIWSANNDAWRFTPSGSSIVNVSWFNGATQISTDSVVQVCPSATTTYTAQAVYTPCAGGTPVTVTDNVTVTLAGSLNAGVDSVKNITCNGLNNGIIYAHATTANPPVTYGWSNGATTLTISNLAAGTYIFTATDASACNRSDTVVITNPPALIANVQNTSVTNCLGTGSGGLTVTTIGGTNPYTYVWTNGELGVSDTSITPGSYTVTVTDQTACTVTASGTFTGTVGGNSVVFDPPLISNESCFGSTNGSIVADATGGTSPYQYIWSNADNSPAITNLAPGPYTVSVTDAGGCTATATYNISQPAILVADTPLIVNDNCGSTAGQMVGEATGGTPVYTYTWTEVSNSQGLTGDTIRNLAPDTYTMTVTDANNCTASGGPYQITQTPALILIDSVNNVSCFGGSNGAMKVAIASGTPPYTYSWDEGAPITDSIITNLSAGPVRVLVTDSNNCMADNLVNITQPQPVSVTLAGMTNVSCNGGSNGTLTAAGAGGTPGYTYSWNNGVTGATDTALAPGSYAVLVTDTNSCTGTGSFNITQPTALSINPPDIQNIGCSGGNSGVITANVTQGTPAYVFNWVMQPGGQTYTGQTISNLAVGNYALTVTDMLGCTDTSSYSITAIPLLAFTVSTTPVSCFNGNNGSALATVTSGTPPYLYSWDNGTYGTDSATGNVTAGALLIHVTDANNCLADTTVNFTQPAQIVITLVSQPTNVICNGGNNGELDVTAIGGTQPYTFNWSNQFIGADNTNLTAGPYTVILVDFNDCADTANYVINQPTPVVAAPTHINTLCYGGADGSIDVNPSGGVPEYSFLWSNGENTQVADNLVKGLYSCTVTDANGCSIIATDTVGQPAQMVLIEDSGIAVLCVGQKNGKAIVAATGDTPPYFYNATQDNVNFISATNGIILGLDTGVYTIQVSDSLGCTIESSVYIPPAIPDGFYAPVIDSTLCFGPDYDDGAVLILDSTIQNGPYQYAIDGGALQDSGYFQNLAAGPHVVTAVSHNDCSTQISVVIPQPLPIVAIVTPDSLTLPLGGSQSVLVTYLNASSPTYNWTPSLGLSCIDCPNPIVNAYTAGVYTVTVSMVNGTATCYGSTTLYLDVLSHTKAFIPNAFTPNGDGNDDVFLIYGEDIKTVSLKIFNRWGEMVYSTTNSLAGWDGTYKGVMQMPSVFSYEAVITYLDDSQENRKGTVTLIR